jgi:hypothetical protein
VSSIAGSPLYVNIVLPKARFHDRREKKKMYKHNVFLDKKETN